MFLPLRAIHKVDCGPIYLYIGVLLGLYIDLLRVTLLGVLLHTWEMSD